jgi:ribosome-associated protein
MMDVGNQAGFAEGRPNDLMTGLALALAGPEVPGVPYATGDASGHDGPEGGLLTLATTGQLTLPSLDRAVLCARVADENKAREIAVLDMRGLTPLYDYLVIATGTSRRLVHTVTEEIDAALREHGDRRLSIAGYESSTWVVQDYGDLMVHVFNPAMREYYGLEELWADAPRVDWEHHQITGE